MTDKNQSENSRGTAGGADVVNLNHQEGRPCGGTNNRVATLTVIRLSPHVKLTLKSIGFKGRM